MAFSGLEYFPTTAQIKGAGLKFVIYFIFLLKYNYTKIASYLLLLEITMCVFKAEVAFKSELL